MALVQLASDIGILVGAISATLFVVSYHITARWWTSDEGRHVMAFTAAMALILDFTTYRMATGSLPKQPHDLSIARAIVFDTIAALLVWRLELLWRVQMTPDPEPEPADVAGDSPDDSTDP